MDEEKRMEWLDGQTLTIPVEEFIQMRLEMAEMKNKYSQVCSVKWRLESELNEVRAALTDAKSQIKEMLGIQDEADKLADLQFEKGVTNA